MSLRSLNKMLVGLSFFACASVFATPYTFNATNVPSIGALNAAGNPVYEINVGANATIISASYNVNITAFSPSWLSEMRFAFTDSGFTEGVVLTPGVGVNAAGTASYSQTVDLVAQGLSFSVGADGILRLEFYESFNDASISPDGIWNSASFTFNTDAVDPGPGGNVPEPATGLLMGAGLALMGYTARRRRNAANAANAA